MDFLVLFYSAYLLCHILSAKHGCLVEPMCGGGKGEGQRRGEKEAG